MRGWTVSAVAGAFALTLVSGCSPVKGMNADDDDDDDNSADASVHDASGGPDAAWEAGEVTVSVIGPDGAPAGGVRVIFSNPDGSVASTQNTNGSGRASFDLFPYSSVTVAITENFDGFDIRHNINTVLGVMPGDNIIVGGGGDDFGTGKYMGDLRISINTAFPSVLQYEMRIGCEPFGAFGLGPHNWQVFNNQCNGGIEPVDVIATARDGDYVPIAFQTLFGVNLSSATETPINGWRTDWDTMSINYNNPPSDASFATAEMPVWRRGLDYSLGEPGGINLTEGVDSSLEIRFPPAFGERLSPRAFVFFGTFPDDIDGFATFERQTSATESDLDIDLSNDLLPRITDATFEQNGLDDTRMHYEVDGDPSGSTAGAASIQWHQTIPGDAGNPNTEIDWEWFIILPPWMPSPIELPEVPPGSLTGGAWPPPKGAAINSTVVGFIEASFAGDWDDVRQNNGFELLDDPLGPETPVGAEVRLTVGGLIGFN